MTKFDIDELPYELVSYLLNLLSENESNFYCHQAMLGANPYDSRIDVVALVQDKVRSSRKLSLMRSYAAFKHKLEQAIKESGFYNDVPETIQNDLAKAEKINKLIKKHFERVK